MSDEKKELSKKDMKDTKGGLAGSENDYEKRPGTLAILKSSRIKRDSSDGLVVDSN